MELIHRQDTKKINRNITVMLLGPTHTVFQFRTQNKLQISSTLTGESPELRARWTILNKRLMHQQRAIIQQRSTGSVEKPTDHHWLVELMT